MSRSRERRQRCFIKPQGAVAVLPALLIACGPSSTDEARSKGALAPSQAAPNPNPSTARWDQVRDFKADLAAERHPSDGGGTARVTKAPERVVAGAPGNWTIELTIGEHGIAVGGTITLVPEPFWGWSTPQSERDAFPGYTDVSVVSAKGAALSSVTVGGAEAGMMILTVEDAPLVQADVVTLDYGAGPLGARADRYAGRDARLWLGVDGDGDGVRSLLASSPSIDVQARLPERAVLLGPTIARPGETVRFQVSVLDEWANASPRLETGAAWHPSVAIGGYPSDWEGPSTVALEANGSATFAVTVGAARSAATRLVATVPLPGEAQAEATANPLVVDGDSPRIYWADLHGHSGLSDGTGSPEDYLTYARDVSRLDVIALTDHDHFGMDFLDARPRRWEQIQQLNSAFHDPGRFITLLGYEWTSWIHGHRHVVYFTEEGEVLSSITADGEPAYETPTELWDALRGQHAMTFAHHSSGNPIPVNWTYPPDPDLEPLTEIVSVHGSSEARDAPHVVAGSRDGAFVRDQLDRGRRLGFIGSGDSHDGHPGLPHLSPGYGWRPATSRHGELVGTGGLAAIYVPGNEPALDRSTIYQALKARQTYATSGPRIAIRSSVQVGERRVEAAGTAAFRSAEWIFGAPDAGVRIIDIGDSPRLELSLALPMKKARAHAYMYLRLVQIDGGTAWVGPFWP